MTPPARSTSALDLARVERALYEPVEPDKEAVLGEESLQTGHEATVVGITVADVVSGNALVNGEIRRVVHPELRRLGFVDFTERKAWRRHQHGIVAVVDFTAVGGYAAPLVGCTAFSFGVILGVRHPACESGLGSTPGRMARPDPSACTFQVTLGKRLRQPRAFHPLGRVTPSGRSDCWAVQAEPESVEVAVRDALGTLLTTGLPLLDQLVSPEGAWQALLTWKPSSPRHGTPGLMPPGAPGSPRWREVVHAQASQLGQDPEQALQHAPALATAK